MKRSAWSMMVLAAMALLANDELQARGGRGGGGGGGGFRGGGGGGMARPAAPAAGRSPAMSRPAAPAARPAPRPSPSPGAGRPAVGGAGGARPPVAGGARPPVGAATRPAVGGAGAARPGGAGPGAVGGRPSAGQLNNFLDVPRPSTGAVGAGGARPGGAAADFLQQGNRPAQSPARPGAATLPGLGAAAGARPGVGPGAGRPGAGAADGSRRQSVQDNRAARIDNRGGRIENREQWTQNRGDRVNQIHDQIHDEYPVRAFWNDHPVWGAWAITRPYRWATWGALSGWCGYGESAGGSYSYGESVYYQDGAVYSGDQQIATADEYAQQAADIAASAPETPPEQMQWMSLGVFALTQDGQASGPPPTLYMQLVISKQGVIQGTLNNTLSGETQTLEGMVDTKSQRAAWGITGKERPIVECGIANLTQDSAPALIHFADGQTQQWLLVRLPDPMPEK